MDGLASTLPKDATTLGLVFAAMGLLAAIETMVPLRAQERRRGGRLGTNAGLTLTTLALNVAIGGALSAVLHALHVRGFGLLPHLSQDGALAIAAGVFALDFATWMAHVAMHAVPLLWRIHRVHHADPCVDVTTTLRQHPLEVVVRHAFLAPVACLLGVGVGAFALYRAASVACGLLEHANVRVPRRVARALELVTTWPDMHKIHHSRDPAETDTNYGNLFSCFDRVFATHTPSESARSVRYGLDDPGVSSA